MFIFALLSTGEGEQIVHKVCWCLCASILPQCPIKKPKVII